MGITVENLLSVAVTTNVLETFQVTLNSQVFPLLHTQGSILAIRRMHELLAATLLQYSVVKDYIMVRIIQNI